MDEKMQIESITYERERLDFFTELMKLAQTRYNLLHRRYKYAPYLSEAHQTLSDMGREIHFFGDVVEMLEKGYRKQSEWEWKKAPDTDVVPRAEVLEAVDEFKNDLMDVFIGLCEGNDYNRLNLLKIGDTVARVYNKHITELKKKYTEETDTEGGDGTE